MSMSGELQAALEHRIMTGTTYDGIPALKNPMDAWVYREIIWELQPAVIVEIGNRKGGMLSFFADICHSHVYGNVIGVDIDHDQLDPAILENENIELFTGDAIDAFEAVKASVGGDSCLVIEDSAHTYDHTLAVLRTYSALIQPGGYMICEDGVMAPVAEALETFTAERDDFEADRDREWPVTWNPKGFLRRLR